ncbi:Heat shock 70 kDa protein [Salvia divinorum]|uniref:Heat shock 70 kDa protein n=1 Tax=Salvia divinorum TaxID=28513 RepID=A0ABD1HWF1_SALDI
MALQDRVMKETKDKKNDIESYVYYMRNINFMISITPLFCLILRARVIDYQTPGEGLLTSTPKPCSKKGDAIEERYKCIRRGDL